MKLKIKRDYELDESGVTSVWAWECPSSQCHERAYYKNVALYWENIVRSANNHISWHEQKAVEKPDA